MSLITGRPVTIDGRPALRFERRLPHSPERVWRAVTAPSELAQWFVAPVTWTPALGETWEGFGAAGAIVELDPPRRIAWTWGTEHYSFDVHPEGDGSRLVFVHVIAAEMPPAQTAAGWETYLDRLGASLAGAPLSEEDAHGPVSAYHEAHAAAQGVDPAPGRAFFAGQAFRGLALEDGPQLRLERRFPVTPDRIWSMLTEPDDLAAWFPGGAGALVVERAEAPRLLEGRWYGERLVFELHEDPVGCRLVFTHRFEDGDTAARTAAGWDRCFARFDARLAGVDLPEPDSLEHWPAVHERYAERFGVDPEIGRRAYAKHPLT